MKSWKKLFVTVLSVVMVLALAVTAYAADNCTITIKNATVGHTYSVYKLFDATYSNGHISYTVTDGTVKSAIDNDDSSCPFQVAEKANSDGGYAVTLKNNNTTADAVIEWIKNSFAVKDINDGETIVGYRGLTEAAASQVADGTTVTFTGLDYGYYFVTSSLGSTLTLDSVDSNITIYDKNVEETPITKAKKKILVEDATAPDGKKEVGTTTAQIGDKIEYAVSFEAQNSAEVNWGTTTTYELIKEYTVVDTPTNLDIDISSIIVKVNGKQIEANAYSATEDNDGKVTIKITWANQNGNDWTSIYTAAATVEITYSATLTATEGQNEAEFNYATVTGYEPTDPVDPEDPDNPPTVYTNSFGLVKTDEASKLLNGATFELYRYNEKIYFVYDEATSTYTVADAQTTGAITTITAGNVTIDGLDGSDTYSLTETKAPDGYNRLETSVPVTFKLDNSTEKYLDNPATVDGDTYSEGGVQVENKTGTELPSTGGMGTTVIYTLGIILVLGAGILLVVRRRMSASR